jgi:acyl carrier protein
MDTKILNSIKECLLKTLNLDPQHQIESSTLLKEQLGVDSMSSLTFLISLEESIPGFTVDPDTLDADHLVSVQSVYDYVSHSIQL